MIALDTTPTHPAATAAEAELLAWHQANKIERANFVSGGRYRFPRADGTNASYTRMSRLAGTCDDDAGLVKWQRQNIVRGLQAQPDLLTTEGTPNDIAYRAGRRGGDDLKADLGTAIHTALERHALGYEVADVPAPYDRDVAAIIDALASHRLVIVPAWTEATVINEAIGAAGRIDLACTGPWGAQVRICDLKTGSLDYGIGKWSAQLRGYATADKRWDEDRGALVDAAPRDTETGIILHAPLGAGVCHVYEISLDHGARVLDLACQVRAIRGKHAELLTPHQPGPASEPTPVSQSLDAVVGDLVTRRNAWARGRLNAIRHSAEAREIVLLAWPEGVPTAGPWEGDALDGVLAAISAGEQAIGAAFPPEDPASVDAQAERAAIAANRAPRPLGPPVTPAGPPVAEATEAPVALAACEALRAEVRAITNPDTAALMRRWLAEGQLQGVPWTPPTIGTPWPVRTYHAVIAAKACAAALYDADDPDLLTRAAWHLATGTEPQPTWRTGALIGASSTEQLRRLTQIANAMANGDDDTAESLGRIISSTAA